MTDMTLGEMIAAHSQPAPPPYVAPPPAPVIPTNAAEAVARLNELKGTAEWRDQYLSGSSSHAKELRALEAVINNGDHPDVATSPLLDATYQASRRGISGAEPRSVVERSLHDPPGGVRDEKHAKLKEQRVTGEMASRWSARIQMDGPEKQVDPAHARKRRIRI